MALEKVKRPSVQQLRYLHNVSNPILLYTSNPRCTKGQSQNCKLGLFYAFNMFHAGLLQSLRIYIEENTTKIANNLSAIAENYQKNSHEPDLGRFLYRVNKLIPRKVRDANLIRKVTSPTLNRPVSQYERQRAVALASSACVDKTTKIVTEFTRKDSSDLKRAN